MKQYFRPTKRTDFYKYCTIISDYEVQYLYHHMYGPIESDRIYDYGNLIELIKRYPQMDTSRRVEYRRYRQNNLSFYIVYNIPHLYVNHNQFNVELTLSVIK